MSTANGQEIGIPAEVLAAYYDESPELTRLSGGEINVTWLATEGDRQTIIQRLSPIFGRLMLDDMAYVTDQLTEAGWEVPQIIETRDGELGVEGEPDADGIRALWRVTTFTEADDHMPRENGPNTFTEYGDILARLHLSLATVDYEPQFRLPHFHETDYYMDRLRGLSSQMPDPETSLFASNLLDAYDSLLPLPESEPQIIHGDPKTTNLLFRNGEPFTYIDWDTIMRDTIWIDIGDRMRSLVEDSILRTDEPLPVERLREFTEGYREKAMSDVDGEEFFTWSMTAMQRIALELATRYINDIVDDNYWVWDDKKFSSRRNSNVSRAMIQWKIYSAYSDKLNAVR